MQLRFLFTDRCCRCLGLVGVGCSATMSLPGFKENKFETKFCQSLANKPPRKPQNLFCELKEIPALCASRWMNIHSKQTRQTADAVFLCTCPWHLEANGIDRKLVRDLAYTWASLDSFYSCKRGESIWNILATVCVLTAFTFTTESPFLTCIMPVNRWLFSQVTAPLGHSPGPYLSILSYG